MVLRSEVKDLYPEEYNCLEELLSIIDVRIENLDYYDLRITLETIKDYGDRREWGC